MRGNEHQKLLHLIQVKCSAKNLTASAGAREPPYRAEGHDRQREEDREEHHAAVLEASAGPGFEKEQQTVRDEVERRGDGRELDDFHDSTPGDGRRTVSPLEPIGGGTGRTRSALPMPGSRLCDHCLPLLVYREQQLAADSLVEGKAHPCSGWPTWCELKYGASDRVIAAGSSRAREANCASSHPQFTENDDERD